MRIRFFCGTLGGLAVGFALGMVVGGRERPQLTVEHAPPLSIPVAAQPVRAASMVDSTSETPRSPEAETLHRLEVLKWLKSNDELARISLRLRVFDDAELLPGFVKTFGLAPEEVSVLEAATRRANARMTDLFVAAAKVRVAEDNSRAWVEVPALPAAGGQVYDELLQVFRTTMGPSRMPYFEEFAADSFEHAFGNFGVRESSFELQRKTIGNGQTKFSI